MWKRQKTGSVICPYCGKLVGVRDDRCFSCGRSNPGMWGLAPALRKLGQDFGFLPMVLFGCTGLYVATLLIDPSGIRMGGMLSFLSPSLPSLFLFGASGAIPVFQYGRWWTILSAAWLHGGLLHILFNLYWVRQLGSLVADVFGPTRLVILYTVSSATGFLLSSTAGTLPVPFLQGAGFTVGASAPIFGLLGALVYYGRFMGSSRLGRQAWVYAMVLFVFGLIMPNVDNFAHLGGFLGGYFAVPLLDPRYPEKFAHLAGALICVGLTVLSIVLSVVHGLALFMK